MRKPFRWLVVVALALAFAAPAIAQENPGFVQVSTLEFAPDAIDPFLEQVKTVRDAAVEIGLAPEHAWSVYRWESTLVFVSWHESMASFDDPQAMVRAFQGTPVESRVMAAFQAGENAEILEGISEVYMPNPDLRYAPANSATADGHQGVWVAHQWPKAGQREAYLESVGSALGMLEEMGGTYPVNVYESYIGTGGFNIVVSFDTASRFYGENSIGALLEESGMQEEWQRMGDRHDDLLHRAEAQILFFLPEHSYLPDDDS